MTVAEIIRRKYSSQDKRNEVKVLLREKLKISESHFFKKLNGDSPLTLAQAKTTAEVLKVSISKLAVLVLIVFSLSSCKNPEVDYLEKQKLQLEIQKLKNENLKAEFEQSNFIFY